MATSKAEQEKRALVRSFHRAFDAGEGAIVLAHLKEVFGYGKSLTVRLADGKVDPIASHIKEGQQDPIRYIDQVLAQMPLDDSEDKPTQTKVVTA